MKITVSLTENRSIVNKSTIEVGAKGDELFRDIIRMILSATDDSPDMSGVEILTRLTGKTLEEIRGLDDIQTLNETIDPNDVEEPEPEDSMAMIFPDNSKPSEIERRSAALKNKKTKLVFYVCPKCGKLEHVV